MATNGSVPILRQATRLMQECNTYIEEITNGAIIGGSSAAASVSQAPSPKSVSQNILVGPF